MGNGGDCMRQPTNTPLINASLLQVRFLGTASSRPPLLVRMLLYIVKIAISLVIVRTPTRKSGGRKPPWLHERDCKSVRQHTGAGLPNDRGSAVADADPGTQRVDSHRSW